MHTVNQTGSILVISIVVFLSAAIGGTGYYVYSTVGGTKTDKAISPNSSVVADNTDTVSKNDESREESDDTALRSKLSALSAAVAEYTSNNNGKLPTDFDQARSISTFGEAEFEDWQNGEAITSGTPEAKTFYFATGHTCDQTTGLMRSSSSERNYAIVALLGTGKPYCQE